MTYKIYIGNKMGRIIPNPTAPNSHFLRNSSNSAPPSTSRVGPSGDYSSREPSGYHVTDAGSNRVARTPFPSVPPDARSAFRSERREFWP